MNTDPALLNKTRQFWDANPCDGQPDLERRTSFRYGKESWLPGLLDQVARHMNVLEIGCGQGTDAVHCCARMALGARYLGVDLSPVSVEQARLVADQAAQTLRVMPQFAVANAEQLAFPDNSFDCVYSLGVLHHTANTEQALAEAHRVLAPGGTAYIALYRTLSPKLVGAHAVRALCAGLDALTGRPDTLLSWVRPLGTDHFLGTMLHEAAGVPVLRSYSRRGMLERFAAYRSVRLRATGVGFSLGGFNRFLDRHVGFLGAMWVAEATK